MLDSPGAASDRPSSPRVLLTLDELAADAARYDEAVLRSPYIDHFCSSSFWILPAVRHLHAPKGVLVTRDAEGYVVLARSHGGDGAVVLHPFESMWALPCPLIGERPDGLVELFAQTLENDDDWDVAFVAGLAPDAPLLSSLVSRLGRRYRLAPGPATKRHVADLSSGLPGFLATRSRGFRENLRKAQRRANRAGVRFEVADEEMSDERDDTFERILAVERRSWKGLSGVGIDSDPMRAFYRDMNECLVARKARRLSFARIGDEDVAYIFGGRAGTTYRGLQFSFDARFGSLSLGNLCQLEEIRRASEDGLTRYDLGTDVGYKRRWSNSVFSTASLFVYS